MNEDELIKRLNKAMHPINDALVRQKFVQIELRLREIENRLGMKRDVTLLKRCKG